MNYSHWLSCSLLVGVDFLAGVIPRTLVFRPQDQRLAIPISLIGDNVFEEDEDFLFKLTIPETAPLGYELGTYDTADVIILDDEGKFSILQQSYCVDCMMLSYSASAALILGFEQPQYTVGEGNGSVEVCVRILEPDMVDGVASAFSTTFTGTAGL